VEDVPDEIRSSMKFIFAESVDDVLNAALEPVKPTAKEKAKKRKEEKKSKSTKVKKNAKSINRRR
jgi:hypothetical protein